MYRLLIEDDEGRTTIVPLIRNQINIGREEGNTIRLTERNVSRRHARLALKDGNIIIEDLQSYNGVWINGSRIDSTINVNPGDLLEIGDYHLSIQEEATDAERKARPSLPPEQDFDEQTPPLGVPPLRANEESTSLLPSRLVVINTSLSGREFLLNQSEMTIGRTDDNDICLDHASVSRNHAKIVQQGDAYQLLDLGSANGIQVNGEEYGVCDLRWGDILELGQVRLRFTSPDTPREDIPLAAQETSAIPSPASRRGSKPTKGQTPLLLGLIALIALAGGGAWFLMSSPSDLPDASSTDPLKTGSRLPPTPRDDLSTRNVQDRLFKRAEDAFQREEYAEALQLVLKLLSARSDWEQAKDLKKRTLNAKQDLKRIEEARDLKNEGDFISAYKKLGNISKDSRYYNKALEAQKEIRPQMIASLMDKATRAMSQKNVYVAQSIAKEILALQPGHEGATAMLKSLEERIHKTQPLPPDRRGSSNPPIVPALRRRMRRRLKIRRRRRTKRRTKPRTKAPLPTPDKKIDSKPLGSDKAECMRIYKNKKFRKALLCLEKWVNANPKDDDAYVFMGSAAGKIGRCNGKGQQQNLQYCVKAARYYNTYLMIAPNGRYAPQIRKALKSTGQ